MGRLTADALQRDRLDFEHRGRSYAIERIGSQEWKVTDPHGRNTGTLRMTAVSGEGGEPVFAVSAPASDELYLDGSDWESLVRALINDTEAS